MVTEKMIEAFVKASSVASGDTMDCVRAGLEAALSTDAEPVAWYWEDATGCFHMTLDRPDVIEMAKTVGCTPKPLYPGVGETSRFFDQPAPSVAVKAEDLARQLWGYFKGDSTGGTTAMRWFDNHKSLGGPAHLIELCRSALSAQVQDVAIPNSELVRMVDIAEDRLVAIHKALHPEKHGISGIESPEDHVAYMVGVLQAAYDGVTAAPAAKLEEKP